MCSYQNGWLSTCNILQVSSMNHGSAVQSVGGEDPSIKALTHIFEKAALVNYKQIFGQLEGE